MTARLVIGASRSGEGKTSVVLGLARALHDRGLRVGIAKVGPDYLDTGWHALATDRPARNLDLWTMGEDGVRAAFSAVERDADVVLIEGVMGLFDGHRTGAAATSTADVAALLEAPVVLVLDASHAGASVAAAAHGFATFDPAVAVAGVVLNRFGVHRERAAVEAAFARTSLPVLGWIPAEPSASIASRHLGLVQSEEDRAGALDAIAALGRLVEAHADVDGLAAVADTAGALAEAPATWAAAAASRRAAAYTRSPRIAVARDEAFSFYYADNLAALEDLGADVVPFSPLHDERLPDDVAGVYLGGGYPELYAAGLSANRSMAAAVAQAADRGMPLYAECGGMLYLLESLTDGAGVEHAMAGVVPARAEMGSKLQRVGYVEAELATPCVLGVPGTTARAHEFRYSACVPAAGGRPAWLVEGEPRGFVLGATGNVVVSYLHLNFAGCPGVAASFVDACRDYATATGSAVAGPSSTEDLR